MEPKREEDEEGVPEVCRPGDPEKQALGILIVGLQVVGGAHPKTLHGIHYSIHLRERSLSLEVCEGVKKHKDCCCRSDSWLVLYQRDPLPKRMLTLIFGPCTCAIKQREPGAFGRSVTQTSWRDSGKTKRQLVPYSPIYCTQDREEVIWLDFTLSQTNQLYSFKYQLCPLNSLEQITPQSFNLTDLQDISFILFLSPSELWQLCNFFLMIWWECGLHKGIND